MVSTTPTIVTLRLTHLRAQEAVQSASWHLATQHYLHCLEQVELGGNMQCYRFFAEKLAHCYQSMGLLEKARRYRQLAEMDEQDGVI